MEHIRRKKRRYLPSGIPIISIREWPKIYQDKTQHIEHGLKPLPFTWGSPREQAKQRREASITNRIEQAATEIKEHIIPRKAIPDPKHTPHDDAAPLENTGGVLDRIRRRIRRFVE